MFSAFSPIRLFHSFRYAFRGMRYVAVTQSNMHVHLVAALLVVFVGLYIGLSNAEWGLLGLTISAVWAAETFNTAIELLTDMVSPQFDEQAGRVKDVSAAAVSMTALGAVAVAVAVFAPKIFF